MSKAKAIPLAYASLYHHLLTNIASYGSRSISTVSQPRNQSPSTVKHPYSPISPSRPASRNVSRHFSSDHYSDPYKRNSSYTPRNQQCQLVRLDYQRFNKPGEIVYLLDEACMFPKSTHETFAQKLYRTFQKNKRFSKPKLSRTDFTIVHYAGEVTYRANMFIDKNKDYVVAEHQALLTAAKCNFVAALFPPLPQDSSKSSNFSSIRSRFKYIHGISNKTYPQELIDDLRDMWVKYFFQQIEDRH